MKPFFPVLIFGDGDRSLQAFTLHAWLDEGASSVWWDVSRLAELLLPGRNAASKGFNFVKGFRRTFHKCLEWLHLLGAEWEHHFVSCIKSARKRGVPITDRTRRETIIDSFGVLVVTAWGSHHLHGRNAARCKEIHERFLELCLPRLSLHDTPFTEILREASGRCAVGCDEHNLCCHVRAAILLAMEAEASSRQTSILMLALASDARSCPAAADTCSQMFASLSKGIYDEWGERDFSTDVIRHTVIQAGRKRRRNIPEDLKAALRKKVACKRVSIDTLEAGSSGHNIVGSYKWHRRWLARYMAAGWREFGQPSDDILVVGVCFDAARLGQPKEETLNFCIQEGSRAMIGIPMVSYDRHPELGNPHFP